MDIYDENIAESLDVEDSQILQTPYFNFHEISKDDMNNGEGLRVVLWLSGCSHRCPGCQNPETWSCNSGIPFTEWDKIELFEALDKDYIQGITLSGGDPLYQINRTPVGELIKEIKGFFQGKKDVWLYTGYTLEKENGQFVFIDRCPWLKTHDVFTLDYLDLIDVIVDGPFEAGIRKSDLEKKSDPHWRGSSNQRVIDVKQTLATGNIVIIE